jgi:hypothetical protein
MIEPSTLAWRAVIPPIQPEPGERLRLVMN